ncbi:MAG TPA: anti-sigma factor, partial [Dongiaceae bacterium]|nr:anti-sigma factor [Dongiaceae bacterium]
MTVEAPVSDADLHAAADGRLAPEREAALVEHLAAHPEDAERVAAYRRLNSELHRVYDPVLGEATPAGWSMPRRRSWSRRAAAAAAVAGLLLGAAA